MGLIAKLNTWVLAEDARTWAAHAIIAVLLALAFSPQIAVGYYTLREGEQVLYQLLRHERGHWIDHVMDVVSPAVAVGLLVLVQAIA